MDDLLFVYGTLNPEEGIVSQIGVQFNLIGQGTIKAKWIRGTEYPAVVPESYEQISGLVIRLKDPINDWPLLDDYEAFYPNDLSASLYVRGAVTVEMENGKKVESHVYWYNSVYSEK